jgi:hypothetical protein
MPVGVYPGANSYTGNGVATVFAYSFRILASADLKVIVGGVTKVLTTDYTVSGVGDANGGNVTFVAAPANLAAITIERARAYKRDTDYQRSGSFDEETVDADFDATVMLIQQVEAITKRSFKAPVDVVTDQVLTSADWTARAGKALGFSGAGVLTLLSQLPNAVTTAFVDTLLDDATADDFLQTLLAALTEDTDPDESADFLLAYDTSASAVKKVKPYRVRTRRVPGGRLSLETGVAVSTSDQAGKTSVFYTPYQSDEVELYDGTAWVPHVFTELSQTTADNTKSPAAVANNSNYDVFAWDDAGTLRATRGPAWTSDTARGAGAGTTELELFEGRHVNKVAITNGPAARRGLYVGTIRSDGSAQINDTLAKRHVWNTYNRVLRAMKGATETTDSWTYTTATFRQANANAANQLDYVAGLAEDAVFAQVFASAQNNAAANTVGMRAGIGVDSTTTTSAQQMTIANNIVSASAMPVLASYRGIPGIGRRFLAWLEWSTASGTTTWFGDDSVPDRVQHGIIGEVMA